MDDTTHLWYNGGVSGDVCTMLEVVVHLSYSA